jgi:hypothetical protein
MAENVAADATVLVVLDSVVVAAEGLTEVVDGGGKGLAR